MSGDRRSARLFLLTVALTSGALVAAGWATGLREAAYSSLVGIAAVALLPLLIGMCVVALITALVILKTGLLGLLFAESVVDVASPAGSAVAEAVATPYYGFLKRQRHPVVLGAGAGAVAGMLVLFVLLAWLVFPGEARSAQIMARTCQRLEEIRQSEGRLPRADAAGHLPARALDGTASEGKLILDGFGRPLRYDSSGLAALAKFRLSSDGYDGREGTRDDLTVRSETLTSRLGRAVGSALLKLAAKGTRDPKLRDTLEAISGIRGAP